MNLHEFKKSLTLEKPPAGIEKELVALWYETKGSWEKAHNIVQARSNTSAAWVHAFLHRKEGDLANASFWYASAGRRMPELPVVVEWEEIVKELLEIETQG